MRKPYKPFPIDQNDPTLRVGENVSYWPVLQVRLGFGHATSPRFDAIVDSGSPWPLFKADLGKLVGIKVEQGMKYPLGGVIANITRPTYFHKVKIYVETDWVIECIAGFCPDLGVTGILGRNGFFSNFKTTFDHSGIVPAVEIERISKPI
jgi:hypothetical protein